MDRMLYVAMSGARQSLLAQAAVTHNLANAATTGFLADLEQFRAMPVFGSGHPSRVYALVERPAIDHGRGSIAQTGNPFDVAINGAGFLAVQTPDGGEAYTRAGDLQLSANGLLLTAEGLPVLGNGGPIAIPPSETVEIAPDGTISALPLGQPANTLVVIDRLRLVNPPTADLVKGEDGLLRTKSGEPAAPDAAVTVTRGALEGSNVNAVEAVVRMMELQRKFEMQVKMMETAASNATASGQLLRPA